MRPPDLHHLLNQVDPGRLMHEVARITRFERTPTTADETCAFAALAESLTASGLTPKLHALPAYVSLPEGAALHVNNEAVPCLTHAMLPSADLTAEAVYLPDAAAISAAGRREARGKLILTEGLAMVAPLRAAMAAGAAGVIFIAGSRRCHNMIVSPVWGSPEPKDLDQYLTLPAVTVTSADGERLKALLNGSGGRSAVRASLRTTVRHLWADLPLLTADLGPVDKGYLLLTGHVDSWHKGAMDNASGNAAALEIARLLAPVQDGLCRGVRFVFWSGHSHGRYAGSAAYCDAFFQDLHDNAFLHINADCLGGRGATLLTQGACMAETWALGDFALRTVTGEGGEGLEGTRFGRSCDQSFWGTGTPSLFSAVSEQPKPACPEGDDAASRAFSLMFGGSKSGGYGWWWHTDADTDDKLDPALLARDTRVFLAAVYRACTDAILPLDIRQGFADFANLVRDYAGKAPQGLDFAPLLADVARVEALLAGFDPVALPPEAANSLILRVEKRLVPLMWVKGSAFGHDPALRQAPLPLLEELHTLPDENDPHRRHSLTTLLRRRLNAVRHGVREIAALLEQGA